MWLKKCTCFLLACVAVFGCLFTPVAAAELGEQKVEIEERRASGKFDFDIPAKTLMKASSSFPMEYGETVTITASYTPASASMDFGLIDSDGTFYPVRANNGSINQTIRIDLRGNYTFAMLAPGAHSQLGSGKNTQFEPEQRANPFENVFSKTAVFPPPAIAETDL